MIRVVMVVASSRGGGAAHVRDLSLGLARRRYAVEVVMPADGGHVTPEGLLAGGVPCHTLPIHDRLSPGVLGRLRGLAARADVLHVHGPRAALWGRLAALGLGGRGPTVVYTVHALAAPHEPGPRRAVLLGIERALARRTDRFIAVSAAQKREIVSAAIAPPERVAVIHNGVDVDRYAPRDDAGATRGAMRRALDIPPDAPLATMVCRLYRPRDWDTLLIAWRQMRETLPEARLLIVGDGPDRPRIEALVAGLWLGEHVTLAGMREDVPEILAASDLLVHATAGWEGMPLSILEAMAAGLPVVASDVGGIAEAVAHGETGRLVPPGSPAALARALHALLADSATREAMGARALERAAERFSLPRMLAATASVYAVAAGDKTMEQG